MYSCSLAKTSLARAMYVMQRMHTNKRRQTSLLMKQKKTRGCLAFKEGPNQSNVNKQTSKKPQVNLPQYNNNNPSPPPLHHAESPPPKPTNKQKTKQPTNKQTKNKQTNKKTPKKRQRKRHKTIRASPVTRKEKTKLQQQRKLQKKDLQNLHTLAVMRNWE